MPRSKISRGFGPLPVHEAGTPFTSKTTPKVFFAHAQKAEVSRGF